MIIRLHPTVAIDLQADATAAIEISWNDVYGDDLTRSIARLAPVDPHTNEAGLPYVLYPHTYNGELILKCVTGPIGRIVKVHLDRHCMSFLTTDHHNRPQWDFGFSWQTLTILSEPLLEQAVNLCRPR